MELYDVMRTTFAAREYTGEEVPDEVEEEEAPEESLPEPEPVAEEPKWILSMSNTKAELLVEAERLDLDVNSGNTKSEILAAIDASQE